MSDYIADRSRAVKPVRMARALADFARNGRWGQCGGCPVDGDGHPLPELCQFTNRYDHLLSFTALAFQIARYEEEVRNRGDKS